MRILLDECVDQRLRLLITGLSGDQCELDAELHARRKTAWTRSLSISTFAPSAHAAGLAGAAVERVNEEYMPA